MPSNLTQLWVEAPSLTIQLFCPDICGFRRGVCGPRPQCSVPSAGGYLDTARLWTARLWALGVTVCTQPSSPIFVAPLAYWCLGASVSLPKRSWTSCLRQPIWGIAKILAPSQYYPTRTGIFNFSDPRSVLWPAKVQS